MRVRHKCDSQVFVVVNRVVEEDLSHLEKR
jgi:hypothetical protein